MDSGDFSARGILRSAAQQQQQTIDPDAIEARATRVSVSGVSRIREGVVNTLAHRILLARTVSDVAMEAREAAGRLQALGMAKAAYVVLDHTGDGANGARLIDVALECVDGPRYSVRTEAGVNDAEGTAGVTARLINIFGGGEAADFHYTRGSRTRAALQAGISLPVAADPLRSVSFAAAQRSIT
ncbi:hypothetical protein LPJ81_005836, partial [Coemansia sp. IMI 209127]